MADPNSMGMMQQALSMRQQRQAPSGGNMQANYGHLQQAPVMGGGGQMGIGNFMQQQTQGGPSFGVQGGPQFNPGQMRQQMAAQMMQQGVPFQAAMQQKVMQRAPTMQANYGMQPGMDVARMKQDALKGLAKQPAPTFSAGGGMTRPGVMWRGG